MRGLRFLPLATPLAEFEAKVLVARLGAEGIVSIVRGANCSLYPLGSVEVLVAEDDLDHARELLLIDDIEDALSGLCTEGRPTRHEVPADWSLGVILMALFAAGFLLFRLLLT